MATRRSRLLLSNSRPRKTITTSMAEGGLDNDTLSQLLDTKNAQVTDNYLPLAAGDLEKIGGSNTEFDENIATAPTLLGPYTDDIDIYAYGTTIAAHTISTDTRTIIKDNFTTSDSFSGERYGNYFVIGNGSLRVGRISRTLNYDSQSADFTVNDRVTGGTSGATATILEDADAGTSGTLTLGDIVGTFQDNETITDPSGGSATSNGTVTFAFNEIAGAPRAKVIRVIETRLFAGNTDVEESEVRYSAQDDGSNPPFNSWTVDTLPAGPGRRSFRRAGAVRAFETLAGVVITGYESGFDGFQFDTITVSSSSQRFERPVFDDLDFGSERAMINTPKGIFYINERGVWHIRGVQSTTEGNGKDESRISKVLGENFFDDVDTTNADIAYELSRELLLVTVAKASSVNNLILIYNTNTGVWSTRRGVNISRFMIRGERVFGMDARAVIQYELFTGSDDSGRKIACEYRQELNINSLTSLSTLQKIFMQGNLSTDSDIQVHIDIYDRFGELVQDAVDPLTFAAGAIDGDAEGFGTSGYGTSSFGSLGEGTSTIPSIMQGDVVVPEFWRIIIRVTSNDVFPHTINFLSIIAHDLGKSFLLNNTGQEQNTQSFPYTFPFNLA